MEYLKNESWNCPESQKGKSRVRRLSEIFLKLFKIVPFLEIDQILLFANKQFHSNFFHDF